MKNRQVSHGRQFLRPEGASAVVASFSGGCALRGCWGHASERGGDRTDILVRER